MCQKLLFVNLHGLKHWFFFTSFITFSVVYFEIFNYHPQRLSVPNVYFVSFFHDQYRRSKIVGQGRLYKRFVRINFLSMCSGVTGWGCKWCARTTLKKLLPFFALFQKFLFQLSPFLTNVMF